MNPVRNKEPQRNDVGASAKTELLVDGQNKTDATAKVKPAYLETRRNASTCFRTKTVGEPHYAGVMVVENLPSGAKVWVNIGVREIKTGKRVGQKYLSVSLRPFNQDGGNA
jgi:hypothetical protein